MCECACALILLCVISAASGSQFVVIDDVSTRDSRPIYDVSLPKLGAAPAQLAPTDGGDVVRVVTARGQALLCGVPAPPAARLAADDAAGQGDRPAHDEEDDRDELEGIEELMDEYRGKCYRRAEGWWQYEFCFGASIEQRHDATSPNEEATVYVLGKLDPEFDAERRRQRVADKKAKRQLQHPPSLSASAPDSTPYTQLFGNGTICEIGGRPRTILVQYKCNQEALQMDANDAEAAVRRNFISAVREVETCSYEIEFVNSAVCNHPAYKSKLDKSTLHVKCVLEQGHDNFLGLSSSTYRKASINL
jgi:Glucosidase II beta subunit-like protein